MTQTAHSIMHSAPLEVKSRPWFNTFIVIIFLNVSTALGKAILFDPVRGLVEVQVTIDGHIRGSFGIDTGADRLYIDSTFARKHHLPFLRSTPQRPVIGLEGSSKASFVEIRSLRIGKETLYNLQATAIDIGSIIRDKRLGIPDGLIGHEILRRFFVTVDYPGRTLQLQMERPEFLVDTSYRAIRFTTFRHLILVDVTINDSVTVPMILDYCASYTSLSRELAQQLGFDINNSSRFILPAMSLNGIVTSRNVPVSVSDYSDFKKSLKGASFEGIIGASFLYLHKLTIDYKGGRLYIHLQ
ncbi:MAG: aspartyl protease family protein [Candidatus Zixiibacteriota bacterium]